MKVRAGSGQTKEEDSLRAHKQGPLRDARRPDKHHGNCMGKGAPGGPSRLLPSQHQAEQTHVLPR